MKLAKMIDVQVLGFVEDKHTFNTFNFMKNRLWNWLSLHLDPYRQQYFTFHNFPYDQAIAKL
jgi:hypothetical protein